MKYIYTIERQATDLPVMQLPSEISQVTTFLFSDAQFSNGWHYLEDIDRVLKSEVPSWIVTGNVCRLEIEPGFTRVIDTLDDDTTNNSCVIETPELRELLVIWIDATKHLATPRKK